MNDKTKNIILLVTPIIFTLLLSYLLQALILSNQEQVTAWLSKFGSFVILVYIILQPLTIIFAPIGGFFLLVAMIALFGPAKALTLSYLVSTPTYLINFYLSKKYGRPLAEKIVGKDYLKKMDYFVEDTGILILIVLRIFQSSNFDYLSYAFGLTKLPFKTFAIVNYLAGIPALIIAYFIYSSSQDLTRVVILSYSISFLFLGITLFLTKIIKKQKKVSV